MKAVKSNFQKIELNVFGASFEEEKKIRPYVHLSVFDADQHPEVHFAGNGCSFALICKESTDFSWSSSDIFDCETI